MLYYYVISDLEIDEEQVSMAIEKNYLDILTIIPKLETKEKGIPYTKNTVATIELIKENEEK